MRSADALPLVICGLDLGVFAAAVAKGRDWGAGTSPGGVAPTGSSPICARCRCGRRRVGNVATLYCHVTAVRADALQQRRDRLSPELRYNALPRGSHMVPAQSKRALAKLSKPLF
jgi:hypothetical protein